MKNKLYKVEDIVNEILINDPHAREDDNYLMYQVLRKTNPQILYKPYGVVLLNQGGKTISFKSVERARRKVQSKYPELKPSDKVQIQRINYENMYIDYAINGDHIPSLY